MPTKKSSAKPQSQPAAADSNSLWKWVFVIGLLVAGVVGAFKFTTLEPYLGWLLLLAGILSAIFFLDSGEIINFAIRYLLLAAAGVVGALTPIPVLGSYLTGFFTGVLGFLGPVGLTLLVMYFWNKYFASMM
jgi:hypothetical protein